MSKTILIADDDTLITQLFHLGCEQSERNLTVISANNGTTAISQIEEKSPDVVVLDLRMPQGDGFSVLEFMQSHNLSIPVVVLTNSLTEENYARCQKYGVKECLIKHEMKLDGIVDRVCACMTC